jgi:hypothetical protein
VPDIIREVTAMIIELNAFTRDAEDRARRVHVISVAGEGRTIAVFPAASVFAAVRRAAREAADPAHDAFLRITLGTLERNVVSATVASRAAVAVAVLLFVLHHAIALCQLVSLAAQTAREIVDGPPKPPAPAPRFAIVPAAAPRTAAAHSHLLTHATTRCPQCGRVFCPDCAAPGGGCPGCRASGEAGAAA